MKNILLLLLLSLFFTACSPKVTIQTLQAPKITHSSIRQLAVMDFKNDTIGQAASIEAHLAQVRFDEKPYFTLIQRKDLDLILNEKKLNDSALVELDNFDDTLGLTQAKTLLQGEVLQSNVHKQIYFKSEKNYQSCLEYNKNKECIRFPIKLIRCQNNDYHVQTQIKIVEVVSSDILFIETYNEHKTLSQCHNSHLLPSKQEYNTQLAQRIAQRVLKDLAPYYKTMKVSVLEDVDIDLTKIQKQHFENALELLDQERFSAAKLLLETLNHETKGISYVILYNLALTYEALQDITLAHTLYQEAEIKSLSYGIIEEISNAIIRTEKALVEINKTNKLIDY